MGVDGEWMSARIEVMNVKKLDLLRPLRVTGFFFQLLTICLWIDDVLLLKKRCPDSTVV